MQIKRFEAQNMTEALKQIKQEFGPDAVILSAKSMKKERGLIGSLRKPSVEVTAAIDAYYPEDTKEYSLYKTGELDGYRSIMSGLNSVAPKRGLSNTFRGGIKSLRNRRNGVVKKAFGSSNNTKKLFTFYQQMLFHGIIEDLAWELIGELNKIVTPQVFIEKKEIMSCLASILREMGISTKKIKIQHGIQKIVALLGPSGVGKTTTLAKLAAASHSMQKKKRMALITLDNYRVAAIEQVKVYARIIGIPIEVASSNKELKRALKKLKDYDFILIDTPGLCQNDGYRIKWLKGLFDRIHPPVETHLLLSASTKDKDLRDILERVKIIPISRLIFTKLDESSTYGNILNQLARTKIPASYFTNGQQVPENIAPASINKLLGLIFGIKKDKEFWSGIPDTIEDNTLAFEKMLNELTTKQQGGNLQVI